MPWRHSRAPHSKRTVEPVRSGLHRKWAPWLIAVSVTLVAQTARANAEDSLVGTEAEQAALRSLDDEKYIRAREQAEAILALEPDAFVSIFVSAFLSAFGRVTNLQPNQRHRVSGGSLRWSLIHCRHHVQSFASHPRHSAHSLPRISRPHS